MYEQIHEAFHPDLQVAAAALASYKADMVAYDALKAWNDKPAVCQQVERTFHKIIIKLMCHLKNLLAFESQPTNYKVAAVNLKDALLCSSTLEMPGDTPRTESAAGRCGWHLRPTGINLQSR